MTLSSRAHLHVLWVLAALWACEDDQETGDAPDADLIGGVACTFDDSEGAESALALSPGEPAVGHLCPVNDQDWYNLEIPARHRLAEIKLSIDAPITPVEPTYYIRDSGGQAVASPEATEVGGALNVHHCLEPGAYHLVVRDQGDDAQDRRSPYQLTVTTAPDPDESEPNDGPAKATTGGGSMTGYIACAGDADWYQVTIPAGEVLRFELEMPAGGIQPRARVIDATGTALYEQVNLAGRREATEIERSVVVNPGTYYVVIDDDDGVEADPNTPYTLRLNTSEQLDPNEPNDRASEAAELGDLSCGGDWSAWVSAQGTIGVVGDPDWFRIGGAEDCGNGIIEAEVFIQTEGLSADELSQLQADVQLSLALVRGHPATECTDDEQCREINRSCDDSWGCAGYFNTCMPSGKCAGATACLKEGWCGAFETERHYDASADPAALGPTPTSVKLSAPILQGNPLYLRVSDFRGDGQAPRAFYEVRARVRRDPDTNEPSNVYTPNLTRDGAVSVQRGFAQEHNIVPVHDCTWIPGQEEDAGVADAGAVDAGADAAPDAPPEPTYIVPGCCGPGDWIEGALSYEADQDWYAYAHPCPGEDCSVRINLEVDGGPVDQLWQIYQRNSLWFDSVLLTEERDNQRAFSGAFGGDQPTDRCFYAYQGHREGASYSIAIRDLLPVADWSADQRYRFCIEKLDDACPTPPCVLSENGECDAP